MLTSSRLTLLGLLLLGFLAASVSPVAAAGGGGGGGNGGAGSGASASGRVEDPQYAAGVKAIKAKEYAKAIPLFEGVITRDGNNADAHNWLAYAIRKNGDPKAALPHYQKALAIDPKHRGAHEYIGEAYLMLDDLPKAKEHLKALDSLCFLPCSEYRDLKKAVEAYEKSGGKTKPTAASQ